MILLFLFVAMLTQMHLVSPKTVSFSLEDIEETMEAIGNIIGGEIAEPGSTPWLVSFKDKRYSHHVHFCGGSILDRHWIVTAAHCIQGYDHPGLEVEVVLGDYDLNSLDFLWEQRKQIEEVFIHPSYDYFTRDYDVALIRVSSEIKFNTRVSPLPLPPKHAMSSKSGNKNPTKDSEKFKLGADGSSNASNGIGKPAIFYNPCHFGNHAKPFHLGRKKLGYIAGWGITEENDDPFGIVHEAYVPILRKEICHVVYPGVFTQAMMCAGNLTAGGVDPCSGDFGGPLVDSEGYLRGISSWSLGCGIPGFPAVYVDIDAIQEWICDILDDDQFNADSNVYLEEEERGTTDSWWKEVEEERRKYMEEEEQKEGE